jgi:HD superfamily phosphohydrolase
MTDTFKKSIFDSIHGFIAVTQTEDKIISSPYFQRLRWIKQLGWSHYIYPGATHTRFAHALGVMAVMDKILKSIGRGVDEDHLFNSKAHDEKTMFHRKLRIAALLHDIGTFPFSHSVEQGYTNHYKTQISQGKKVPVANHEELGSHIVNGTDFEGGITHILKADGFDPKEISLLIRGQSDDVLANQLVHSDIDADRIDYLVRDSHHTGLKYGVFDMEYLISNFRAVTTKDSEVLAINESALTAVEYFLISRYTWYSQIINDGTGYKFDLLASRLSEYLIETGHLYTFEELRKLVSQNPRTFFGFNDSYFTAKLQEILIDGSFKEVANSPMIGEGAEMLMFRQPPRQIRLSPFAPSLVTSQVARQRLVDNIHEAVAWLRSKLSHIPQGWVIEDIPKKDVIFTQSAERLKKNKTTGSQRDTVYIVNRQKELRLLVEDPNSIVGILSTYQNFIPRVYVSKNTYRYLQDKGLLREMEELFGTHARAELKSA